MDTRRGLSSPPNPSSDTHMYSFDGLDDNGFALTDTPNPTFDYNDFINSDYTSSPMSNNVQLNFGSPAAVFPRNDHSPLPQLQPRSVVSSASPESSTQDSSSDSSGRRKRKSPSSSASAIFGSYPSHDAPGWIGDNRDMDRGKRRVKVDSPVFQLDDPNMGVLNTSMTESFNINSAGNSPPALVNTPSTTKWNGSTPKSAIDPDMATMPVRSRTPATFGFGPSSRDNTPPSALSFESQQTPFLTMRDSPDTDGLTYSSRNAFGDMSTFSSMFSSPPLPAATASTVHPGDIGRSRYSLHVSPLGHKSRVETQIPIKLTLDPMPPGIKKIHLPTETIAKAKFLAKETPKASDTLELSAMLVCTSAMEKPESKARALSRARDGTHLLCGNPSRRSSTGDTKKGVEIDPNDPDAPANGGPVRICDNCVSRERKRAGRKKAKKQDDEERWYEYEHDRIIMFNTQEYLEFHPPTAVKEAQYYDPTVFSPDAMQVDAPMRIVCYCRHQQEKIGFQVIFTLKDCQGNVVAQEMTQSILITDDHKTHTNAINANNGLPAVENSQYGMPSFMGAAPAIQPHGLPGRAYHSSTNLAGMSNPSYWSSLANTNSLGQTSTSSMTPRNLSRPASPSGHVGPKKKRKGSGGQHKVPANLMMTRADLEPLSIPPGVTSAPQSINPLLSPDSGTLQFDASLQFTPVGGPTHFNTNPPTPNGTVPGLPASSNRDKSTESQNYFYSAPNSAHASRTASPTSFNRPQMAAFHSSQSQLPGASNTPFNSMQFSADDHHQQATPTVYKVRPDRGPTSGNIEIVILGKHFHRNLEVMFGENTATTTTYWNSDTLVCLLPPSLRTGPVPVTFVNPGRQGYSPPSVSSPPMFTYVDDSKQQLFELAIQLQCAAQLGPGADHWNYAQNILAAHGSQSGFSSGQASGFNANVLSNSNAEDLLMAIINKVDLIDSPYKPYYDLKRETGATMLSLACSLGYEKLVAGLLARGADPDVADAGGFTPLMFAAMHGHTAIVRRLILRGADTYLRNLRGITAFELASTPEVRHYVRHRRHYRSVSAGTPYMRSRANSAASTRSLWGPPSSGASSTMYTTEDESAADSDVEEVDPVAAVLPQLVRSRRPSTAGPLIRSRRNSEVSPGQKPTVLPAPASDTDSGLTYGTASTIAVFSALRDQLTAQINVLQQNLPNMQFPELWQEQNFPAIGRRISSLVPMRRETPPQSDSPSSDPPPPYHEACPDSVGNDFDIKPPDLYAQAAESSRNMSVATIRPAVRSEIVRQRSFTARSVTIGKTSPTGEEAAELRRLREEKLTPAKYDRNLWYIWFPLLIVLIIWWFSGLRLPPVITWLRDFNNTLTATVGRALPALPDRLRLTA